MCMCMKTVGRTISRVKLWLDLFKVCMYVYIHIYTYTYTYTYKYTYTYTYTYIYIGGNCLYTECMGHKCKNIVGEEVFEMLLDGVCSMYVCNNMYVCTYMCVCTCVCMSVCMYVCMYE